VTKRILLVDDEETILFAVKRYLDRLGFAVDCARELEEAEALAAYNHYDLVIADLSLSGDDCHEGLEILRYIRRGCGRVRVVLLTAHGCPAVEREAFRRGCDAFLHKPKPLLEIAKVVTELLSEVAA